MFHFFKPLWLQKLVSNKFNFTFTFEEEEVTNLEAFTNKYYHRPINIEIDGSQPCGSSNPNQ